MEAFKKVISTVCPGIYKINEDNFEDSAKYILIYSQIPINFVKLWPEDKGILKKILYGILVLISVIHYSSLILALFTIADDIDSFTRVISSIECGAQVTIKATLLYYNTKELESLIKIIRHDFWPSTAMGPKIDQDILKYTKQVSTISIIEYSCGLTFLLLNIWLPFTKTTKQLPHYAWFPFDWTKSPMYELIYLMHSYFTGYLNCPVVVGYDILYYGICANCIAQFRLLCQAIKCFGTDEEEEVTQRLAKLVGIDADWKKDGRLLEVCVKYHQKLINVCEDINRVYGNGYVLQLLSSAVGICMSCYRISNETNLNNITFLFLFYLAHTSQLFLYCTISHELSYWSTCVSAAAYESLWYLKLNSEVKKSLCMIMTRSQKIIAMHAYGIFVLNHTSFVAVMRFTFTLYTFLTTIAK